MTYKLPSSHLIGRLSRSDRPKIVFLVLYVIANSIFEYETCKAANHLHLMFQEFYLVPLILASFWFGLTGAVYASLFVSLVYFPFIIMNWNHFSVTDFCRVSCLTIYTAMTLLLGVLKDRDTAKQLRIRETESLASIGKALSAVAHDFKTPLIAIGGFSNIVARDLARCQCTEHGPSLEKLKIISTETGRLEVLVKDMLDFARPLKLDLRQEDLNQVVSRSVSVCEASAAAGRLVARLCPCPLPMSIDSGRVEEALINLVSNALQASPENEKVFIRLYQAGRAAVIDITDHGSGIPEDKKAEIFTPFFTTRRGGSGLGLPIARKIIEAHEGGLHLLNNEDRGITARITLPLRTYRSREFPAGATACQVNL
jgi:signal transduction histidine kinase